MFGSAPFRIQSNILNMFIDDSSLDGPQATHYRDCTIRGAIHFSDVLSQEKVHNSHNNDDRNIIYMSNSSEECALSIGDMFDYSLLQ